MPEAYVELPVVLNWVARTDRETAAAIVIGCELDDGLSLQAVPIASLEWSDAAQPAAFVLSDGRRVPVRRLVAGAKLVDSRPGAPLPTAISSAHSPVPAAEREMRRTLGKAGIDADRLRSPDARRAVAVFAWKLERARVPSADERTAAYLAFIAGDTALAHKGKLMLSRLVAICGELNLPVPEDCHWRLACLARNTGNLREAVAVSDILYDRQQLQDADCRKLLATTRCAALLDLAEADPGGERDHLREAQKAFNVAWAIAPRDAEVDALRWRLNHGLRRAGL